MTSRRLLLTLPIVLSVAAAVGAQRLAHAETGPEPTDGAVADGGEAGLEGDAGDDEPSTGCGAAAPPSGFSAVGAGCC